MPFRQPSRRQSRLRILLLLHLRRSPDVLSIFVLVTQSSPEQPHYEVVSKQPALLQRSLFEAVSRTASKLLYGGAGGNRTRVLSTFPSTSYNNNLVTNRSFSPIHCQQKHYTQTFRKVYLNYLLLAIFLATSKNSALNFFALVDRRPFAVASIIFFKSSSAESPPYNQPSSSFWS
jgi:hypothetical protein